MEHDAPIYSSHHVDWTSMLSFRPAVNLQIVNS
jgi:predicted phage terminase large subunit-like protein